MDFRHQISIVTVAKLKANTIKCMQTRVVKLLLLFMLVVVYVLAEF